MIVSSTISPAKAIEISNEIARKGPKMNKRQVSLILTPEEIFVKDTIHQVSFKASIYMHVSMHTRIL